MKGMFVASKKQHDSLLCHCCRQRRLQGRVQRFEERRSVLCRRHAKLRVSRNEFRKMRILVFEISFACMHSGSIFVFKLDLQENA